MPENNQILSVEGQLVGLPLAGPESFSQQQLDYLKRALGVDETVLWEGTATGETSTASLSEVPTNFERIRVYWHDNDGATTYTCFEVPMEGFSSSVTTVKLGQVYAVSSHWKGLYATLTNAGLLTVTQCSEKYILNTAAWTTGKTFTVTKVVGIHRISGGN